MSLPWSHSWNLLWNNIGPKELSSVFSISMKLLHEVNTQESGVCLNLAASTRPCHRQVRFHRWGDPSSGSPVAESHDPPCLPSPCKETKSLFFLPQRSFVCFMSREELEKEPKYQLICVKESETTRCKQIMTRAEIYCRHFYNDWPYAVQEDINVSIFKGRLQSWRTVHNFSNTLWLFHLELLLDLNLFFQTDSAEQGRRICW